MLKYICVVVLWYIFLKKNTKRKDGLLNPSSFLLLVYLISFTFSIIHILYNGITLAYRPKYWIGAIFAVTSLLLFFFPYYSFNEKNLRQIKVPNLKIIRLFSTFLIIISFFSIVYWLPYVRNIFSGIELGDLRNDYVAGDLIVGGGGFFQTLAGIAAHLYYFNIILYFILKSIGVNRTQQILLLISSLSYVVYVLSAVGRDGIVFWSFSFISCFLFFRPFLSSTNINKIKRLIYPSVVLMLVPFIMISSSRFSSNVVGSIISYMGQSLPNFCFYICSDNPPVIYGSSFPYFCELLNIPHTGEYWTVEGTTSKSFGYFIENFYCSLGFLGFVILELSIVSLLLINFKKNKTSMSFSKIILYFLFLQIFTQGVFYFRQYSAAGNILIIISFIFIIFFSFVNNPIIIESKNAS